MKRFTVSTRLNGNPASVWESQKEEHHSLDVVRQRKDKLGKYFLVNVEAYESHIARRKGKRLVEDFARKAEEKFPEEE